MAGTMRVYHAVHCTIDGRHQKEGGSLSLPIKEVIINGVLHCLEYAFQIEPGGVAVLWDYNEIAGFLLLAAVCDGYLEVHVKVDTPIGGDGIDRDDPSGDNERWRETEMSCVAARCWDSYYVRVNPDIAVDVGTVSPTSDYPAAMDDADTLQGRMYRVVLKNRSESTVKVYKTLIN